MFVAFAMMLAVQEPAELPAPCSESYGQLIGASSFSLPPVDVEHEAEVGESIVSAGRLDTHEVGVDVVQPITVTGRYVWNDFSVTIPAGASLEPIGNGPSRSYHVGSPEYRLNGKRKGGIMVPIVVMAVGQRDSDAAHVAINWGLSVQRHEVSLAGQTLRRCARLGTDSFRRDLIYSGVSRGSVTLEYREFSNDLARPAFSQTLTYDLEEGRTIGFRGARFEIISADNLSLKYRVIKHLD